MGLLDQSDQRDYLRVAVAADINFCIVGEGSTCYRGKAHNISASGILFETAVELVANTELDLKVLPGHSELPALRARVRVVRAAEGEGAYLVAGEMSDVR